MGGVLEGCGHGEEGGSEGFLLGAVVGEERFGFGCIHGFRRRRREIGVACGGGEEFGAGVAGAERVSSL